MSHLTRAFARLNPEQKDAVTHPSDTVVLAGPGSGKTDTLVVKVAHLLAEGIAAPRGLACLTYGREAVAEFAKRLSEFGVRSSRRAYLGTVHAFCMDCVIRPFAALAGRPEFSTRRVASKQEADALRDEALNSAGKDPRYYVAEVTRVRRARACREPLDVFDPAVVKAALAYNEALRDRALLDFESMVLVALLLIERYPIVRDLLAARFEWLVVDEYQDLGGPLHKIVSALRNQAGIKIFAVGDPHQTIYDFTGAHPRYLEELARSPGAHVVRLRMNYRSGRRLIRASQAVLSLPAPLDHQAPPERVDLGEVLPHDVPGGVDAQIDRVVTAIIPELQAQGVALEEVAILYRLSGRTLNVLAMITRALEKARIPFNAERDGAFPRGPLVRWLQRAAAWSLAWAAGQPDGGGYGPVAREYRGLGKAACEDLDRTAGQHRRERLFEALTAATARDAPAGAWIVATAAALGLRELLLRVPARRDDVDDLDRLLAAGTTMPLTLAEFAADGRLAGRVVVTTYHSSKGRQFDAVILPALQTGLVPSSGWDYRRQQFKPVNMLHLPEERRLFYVAFTRARRWVHLLASPSFKTTDGTLVGDGPSRFLREVTDRLEQE